MQLSDRDAAHIMRLLKLLEEGSLGNSCYTDDVLERACLARRIFELRALRREHLAPAMFGEPAWDILLALYSGLPGRQPNVTALAEAIHAPATSTMRWIDYLESQGLVAREPSPFDRRVVIAQLTTKGRQSLDSYLSEALRSER